MPCNTYETAMLPPCGSKSSATTEHLRMPPAKSVPQPVVPITQYVMADYRCRLCGKKFSILVQLPDNPELLFKHLLTEQSQCSREKIGVGDLIGTRPVLARDAKHYACLSDLIVSSKPPKRPRQTET